MTSAERSERAATQIFAICGVCYVMRPRRIVALPHSDAFTRSTKRDVRFRAMAKTKRTSKPAKRATKTSAKKKPVKPAAKKPVKVAPTARKTKPAKPARKSKPTQKRKPPQPPGVPQQVLSGDSLANLAEELGDALGDIEAEPTVNDVAGRDAIHVELGAKLAAMRGDEQQERAAIAAAIDSYMQVAIDEGLAPDASAYAARCPDFFWEGDAANPPVYARVPGATHDEIGRWFQLIVEGVRAYDARVGASPSN
jgi:hypothetical protein